MATPKRLPELDGLRAVAILAVFARHALGVRFLWMGVDIFFVLSGFLITGILLDLRKKPLSDYLGHFYKRRGLRILPPYILLLIVITSIFGLGWTEHWYLYLGLTNYFLAFNADGAAVNPLWSLGVEEQFYLIWPFAIYFLNNRHLVYLLCGILMVSPVLRALAVPYDTNHWILYHATIFRMDDFAVGGLMTFIWQKYRHQVERYGYWGLVIPLLTPPLMLLLAHLGGFSTMDGTVRASIVTYGVATAAATGLFVWALGGRYTGVLRYPLMQWLGRISYSFYLIHMTMIVLVERRFTKQSILAASLAFIASTAYAAASWYLMEKRLLQGGKLPSHLTHEVPIKVSP